MAFSITERVIKKVANRKFPHGDVMAGIQMKTSPCLTQYGINIRVYSEWRASSGHSGVISKKKPN